MMLVMQQAGIHTLKPIVQSKQEILSKLGRSLTLDQF